MFSELTSNADARRRWMMPTAGRNLGYTICSSKHFPERRPALVMFLSLRYQPWRFFGAVPLTPLMVLGEFFQNRYATWQGPFGPDIGLPLSEGAFEEIRSGNLGLWLGTSQRDSESGGRTHQ